MIAEMWNAVEKTGLSAAVMILAIVILRLQFQSRTPRRIFCLLWDLTLVRLLVMAEVPSPLSIRRLLPGAVPAERTLVSAGTAEMAGEWTFYGGIAEDVPLRNPPALTWETVLPALWLAGAVILAVWLIGNHLHSRRLFAMSLPVRDGFVLDWLADHPLHRPVQVRCSDRTASPLTYGIWYPVVLLPAGMDRENRDALSWVLAHEYTHIRRFDGLRKGLLAAVLCLHWLNPLVWVMYLLANRDIELACDEAVLRERDDREGYALTLLNMEARRGQWTASGSYFSQNALEERIRAIMKRKHISITALAAVLAVMCLATTVFASAPPENRQNPPTTSYVDTVEDKNVVISNGLTGEKQYSIDGGDTWLSEESYQAQYGGWGDDWTVEWWTYEEYKAWLEQEKVNLQEIIGSQGWTPSTGWFTWDQEKVDEAIALYEDTLEKIGKGALYSKRIIDKNGNEVEDTMLGSDGTMVAATYDGFGDAMVSEKPVDTAKILQELRSAGISGEDKALTYNGQLIRHLVDGVFVGDGGYSVQYVYTNDSGTLDVHTLRSVIYHPDGSCDPMGDLIGLAAPGDKDFDQDLIDAAAFSGGPQATTAHAIEDNSGERGRTFEEIFAQYAAYGLEYQPMDSRNLKPDGVFYMGTLTYNGEAVQSFADLKPDGGCFSYQNPYVDEGLKVYTEYDANGNLTGLRTA